MLAALRIMTVRQDASDRVGAGWPMRYHLSANQAGRSLVDALAASAGGRSGLHRTGCWL